MAGRVGPGGGRARGGTGLRGAGRALAAVLLLAVPVRLQADGLLDQVPNTTNDILTTLFPNWLMAPVAQFDLTVCADAVCPCPNGPIVGVTIYNYGSAVGGTDLSAVYFEVEDGKGTTRQTLTYAGVWTVGAKTHAAWTWSGSVTHLEPGFGYVSTPMRVFADVASCPAEGATVEMGLGFNDILNPATPGGVYDSCGYQIPNYDQARVGRTKFIRYVEKVADRDYVAPGDTVTYTLYYALPGSPSIANVVVTDTIPPWTHYVPGSASAAPDPGWDPDPGPPQRLRWTLPGAGVTTGGPTRELSFQVTVDWGNGEAFEPGSGDIAAVEGARLNNQASVEFPGSGCPGSFSNQPVDTVVRRYVTWKTADQDLLFSPRLGYADDEIVYSIFVLNKSSTKTWWNVSIWDTVPAELTTWTPNMGFRDPCVGWTMTPSGCAAGGPGWIATGPATTLLTWTLDLPPGETIELQWKASASTAAAFPGTTAVSTVNVLALGNPGRIGGTGHAGAPRPFVHLAPIALRTTYFSYVGQASSSKGCASDEPLIGGLFINFYPLNRATVFELRKLFDTGAFAAGGGTSASITAFQGGCLGFTDGGYGGCGPARAPAQYWWLDACPATPNAALYKMTSNAPLLWLLMPSTGDGGDAFTYIPSTTLSGSGFTSYSYRRSVPLSDEAGWGESWVVFNTGYDVNGDFDPSRATTVHIFKWNFVQQAWNYVKGGDIAGNSLWMPFAGCSSSEVGHYKIISSESKITVYQGYGTFGDPSVTYGYNEHGALIPNAENGLNTSSPGGAGTFYVVAHHDNNTHNMLVGNHTAGTKATFRVYHYRPHNPGLATQGIPVTLAGSSGSWDLVGTRTADPALTGIDNPHVFGFGYDALTLGTGSTANAWKIEWVSGGNISVAAGMREWTAWAGGSLMHPASSTPAGQEFWFHQSSSAKGTSTWSVLMFCHSAGMVVRGVGVVDGANAFSATYTTDGPDQCIAFTDLPGVGDRSAYRFELLPAGTPGELIGMYHQLEYREKFFTAPFLSTGLHYEIIAPPVVFSGESFWITVVAVLGSGNTKTDYLGTSGFTSTDPGAKIAGAPMEGYDYPWVPADAGLKVFVNVSLTKLGMQLLSAFDIVDGSVTGVAGVMVVGVDVRFFKEPRLGTAASGDTVTFRICWSNYSSASAFAFTITDAVPADMTYVPDPADAAVCGSTAPLSVQMAHSSSATTTVPSTFADISGGASPPATTRWLRWTVAEIGVRTTGCVCFRASVN